MGGSYGYEVSAIQSADGVDLDHDYRRAAHLGTQYLGFASRVGYFHRSLLCCAFGGLVVCRCCCRRWQGAVVVTIDFMLLHRFFGLWLARWHIPNPLRLARNCVYDSRLGRVGVASDRVVVSFCCPTAN